ncbi:MAG: tRNA 2-thiouridine(34) synthase MnmA [Candidatus Omnitrophota bacterium]
MKNKRVLVAMSGGVDSCVAAYLLKEAGYACVGATIKTWPKEDCGRIDGKLCCSADAISSARAVADKLGIPHYVFDFSRAFREKVVDYALDEYRRGLTPNPCVYCNSEIKFGALLDKARELGCDYVASGHYARKAPASDGSVALYRGKDKKKDQSYFLFNLDRERLKSLLFPLGDMLKKDTSALSCSAGMDVFRRRSSQDICFNVREASGRQGRIMSRDGRVLGHHTGVEVFTIGQRKGLGVAYKEPLYVTGIDTKSNTIHVGLKADIMKKSLYADRVNWLADVRLPLKVQARIRYGSEPFDASVHGSAGGVKVEFSRPQAAPTPGQAVVFYDGDRVLGGGWIVRAED